MTDKPGSISEAIVVHDEELMDPDAAIKKAEELLAGDKSLEKVIARCRQGRKRHPGYGLQKLRPLPGATAKMGGKIRAIVGMRYSGYPDTLIEKAFGWTPSYIQKMEFRHYKAFAAAKEDLLKSAVTEYNQNVAFARAALSESGFAAVDTLSKVMSDKKASTSERIRAAELVLKLTLGSGQQSPGEIASDIISSFGGALAKISTATRQNSYIEDAEAVDVEIDEMDD